MTKNALLLEENDEEQLTITCLASKMKDYLIERDIVAVETL